jgi:co-chaperonin GroES (HSP10)
MKLKGNTVLIMPHGNDEKTKTGIIIPKTAKNHAMTGDVIDIGPMCEEVKKGEKVYYNKRTATILESIDGDDMHFVTEDHIFLIYGKVDK